MGRNATRLTRALAGLSILTLSARAGAVVAAGQVDTFTDGTTNNWGGGGTNIVNGGPAGASDPFLQVAASGNGGPSSKMITYNRDQWVGDYTTAGVNQISVDLKDFASTTLSIRIAFKDSTGQFAGGYATTDGFILPADSAWHHATFSVTAAAMTALSSPGESFDSLIGPGGALAEFRILESASPSLFGDSIAATLGIDNITAGSSGPAAVSATWGAASGNWETGSNWIGGSPAFGAGKIAAFPDPTGTSNATVTLTTSQIIGRLDFTAASGGSYNFAAVAPATLTLSNSSGASIHVAATAGNVVIAVPVMLANDLTTTLDGSTTLTLANGITGPGGLTKAGTGVLAIAAPVVGSGFTVLALPSLTITSGLMALQSAASHADRTLLMPASLSITAGQLDLGGNDAILQGTTLATVQALIKTGYNGGKWNGAGPSIISTPAHSNTTHLTAIGIMSGVTSFDNRTVLNTDVLAKYTYYGDANLDGRVDGSDYSRIDNGYLTNATGWFNGDFNYDGVINGSDYTLIDNAFNMQGTTLAAIAANPNVIIAAEISTISNVPEPAMVGSLLSAALFLLGRRGHRVTRART